MKLHNTIIIGAGPAGIQLAYYFQKKKSDYIVLEGSKGIAKSFHQYPRHRKLISINKFNTGKDDKEYNMRHDWNSLLSYENSPLFKEYSEDYFPDADAFLKYLDDFVEQHNIKITLNTPVKEVSKCEKTNNFIIKTKNNKIYQCRCIVVATGLQDPYIPNIPGIEHVKGYEDVSTVQKDFTNKHVLIIGKGNSALETADHLIPHAATIHTISPRPLQFAWDTRFVGHIRAVNNNFFDTYHLKSQNVSIDADILEIRKNHNNNKLVVKFNLLHAKNETETLEYDEVIRCTGFRFNNDMFASDTRPEMSDCGKLPRMNANFESSNIKGLFYAGTIMQMLDYKKTQSAFIHGFRYNIRSLFHLLEEKFADTPYPSTTILAIPEVAATKVLARFNNVSSLWQQVGYMADILVPEGNLMRWYHDLPYQYILENKERFGEKFYISMLRIKPCLLQSFTHPRTTNVYEGDQSTEIHPVIEYVIKGQIVDTVHVLEDLLSDWSGNDYVKTVAEFFSTTFDGLDYSSVKENLKQELIKKQKIRNIIRNEKMKIKDAAFE